MTYQCVRHLFLEQETRVQGGVSTRMIFPNSNCKLEGILVLKTIVMFYVVLAKALAVQTTADVF